MGPYGIRVIYKIMELNRANRGCIIPLLGNHDLMLREILLTSDIDGTYSELTASAEPCRLAVYIANKGKETLKEFCRLKGANRSRVVWWLKNLKLNEIIEINGNKFYLCHSYPQLQGISEYMAVWDRVKGPWNLEEFNRVYPNHILVSGHTIVTHYNSYDKQGKCKIYKGNYGAGYINIDCGAKAIGQSEEYRLACLRLEDMAEFYSSEVDKKK